jgi:hypothetical protein
VPIEQLENPLVFVGPARLLDEAVFDGRQRHFPVVFAQIGQPLRQPHRVLKVYIHVHHAVTDSTPAPSHEPTPRREGHRAHGSGPFLDDQDEPAIEKRVGFVAGQGGVHDRLPLGELELRQCPHPFACLAPRATRRRLRSGESPDQRRSEGG